LMTMTGARVSYLYDLMDAAYDAAAIHDHSKALGHVFFASAGRPGNESSSLSRDWC